MTTYKNAVIAVGGVNLSDHITNFAINYSREDIDITTIGGATLARRRIAGMLDGSVEVTFLQDFAAGEVEATISGLANHQAPFRVKSNSAARSSTNPEMRFTALVTEWTPLSGEAGDLLEVSVTWPIKGEIELHTAPVSPTDPDIPA